MRYTKTMTYFQKDLFPEFETESSSEVIQNISDCCSNGCACQMEADHNTEFVQDIIDFEQ